MTNIFGSTILRSLRYARSAFDARRVHDRRSDDRYEVGRRVVPFQVGRYYSFLLMKDLSCGGVGGITELPLSLGTRVYLELDGPATFPAIVRWTESTSVGLEFVKPLDEQRVLELRARHWRFEASARH